VTGIDELYSVMGGFHLTGGEFAANIEPTVKALKELNMSGTRWFLQPDAILGELCFNLCCKFV